VIAEAGERAHFQHVKLSIRRDHIIAASKATK
jgi:hypothetical protein